MKELINIDGQDFEILSFASVPVWFCGDDAAGKPPALYRSTILCMEFALDISSESEYADFMTSKIDTSNGTKSDINFMDIEWEYVGATVLSDDFFGTGTVTKRSLTGPEAYEVRALIRQRERDAVVCPREPWDGF